MLIYLDAIFTQNCELFMPPLRGYVLIDKRPALPPLTVGLSIDPEGYVGRWGQVAINGEIACTGAAEAEISGTVQQPWTTSTFSVITPCGETPRAWGAELSGPRKGDAIIEATAIVRRAGTTPSEATNESTQVVRFNR